jgi:Helix-turn-helix domain/RodZ C-terminal domain
MADIGTTLREARMRARIDIGEVETATKIRAKYLRAIENEEWDLLPGPVYVKSFLRTYGDYLGLDSRMLVDEYKRRYERPSDHDPRPVATRTRERERVARGPLLPPWAVIGLVLVAVVVALYIVGKNNGSKSTPPAGLHARTTHHPHRATPKTTATLPAAPTSVTLQLVPTGQVYVCLVDGNGKRLIPGQIFAPGQTVPTETKPKMLLTLGNNSVQMKVNGKPVPVAASASSIGFTLDPNGAHPLPAAQQPRCA